MKPSRDELLTDKVKHVDFDHINTVADLLEAWQDSSIQSRALATAAQVWKDAVEDEDRPTIMLGLSGALIAGGMKKIIRDLVKHSLVDVVVSIGAIPYQDFYQARGHHHYKTVPEIDDLMLREHFLDRIYDTIVDEEKFRETDAYIGEIAESLPPRHYSSREFMDILGSKVDDDNSILRTAHLKGTPVFVPALNDSSTGIGLTGYYAKMLKEGKEMMHIDPIKDNWEISQIKFKSKKTAVIYIGGGVPKNYIQQTEVIAETLGYNPGGHHYAIQIGMDPAHWGGLSGATFREAQSWGKINKRAKMVMAHVEATVGLSLVAGYLLQKKEIWSDRTPLKFKWDEKGNLDLMSE